MDNTYIIWMIGKTKNGMSKYDWIVADVEYSLEYAIESVHRYLSYRGNKPCIFKIALEDDVDWKDTFNYELTKLKKVVK